MNFYIKNTEEHRLINEIEYNGSLEYKELKDFILSKKRAMGYMNEKYDDFVLLKFPTRHDIIHFEVHHRLKLAVRGLVIKTEEAYELISLNIDDKETHLDFLKTPAPPSVVVEIQPEFAQYYSDNKKQTEDLLIRIGLVLLEVDL